MFFKYSKKEISASTIKNLIILISMSSNNAPIEEVELIPNSTLIAPAFILLTQT